MLFQPTNVIPSALGGNGNGTVDVTQALNVSWHVNGNSPMVAYQIKIMQNDTDSTLMLDTGKVSLSSPFFGADALGNPKAYNTAISAADLAAAGIVNGYANGYKFTIKQWWNASDAVEQTNANYFITRTEPYMFLQTIPYRDSFRQQEHTFESFYSQAQEDTIAWYRWELQAKDGNKYVTVDDTGYIYNGGTVYYEYGSVYYGFTGIQYTYNGFCLGNQDNGEDVGVSYRIKCTVQTENGVQTDTGWNGFTTQSLGDFSDPVAPGLCVTRDTDAVKITMPKNFPLMGVSNGPYDYVSGATKFDLSLPNGSFITWGGEGEDSLEIKDAPYYISIKGIITDATAAHTFFEGNYGGKTIQFSCEPEGFYIRYDSQEIWRTNIQPVNGATFGIAVLNESVYFLLKNGTNIQSKQTAIAKWQGDEMQSLSIHGPMRFIDVTIKEGNWIWIAFYNHVVDNNAADSFDSRTQFIATFDYTLYTGTFTIGASGTGRNGNPVVLTDSLAIYRKEKDSFIFKLIADMPLNEITKGATFYDYSAKNQTEYEYYLMFLWEWKYARTRSGIGTITPCFWNYTVLCCSQNNIGDYIVEEEYRFALDVSSGNVGNNNSPMLQHNFTRYPLRQPVSNNFRSGTLSAYIGRVSHNNYVDSASLMDDLYALSTNGLTKFLKTRKGQIFRIETSAPITMGIGDKYAQQPARIGLPWVEVGDASNANILGDSTLLADVPFFSVDFDTMDLLMAYNEKSVMGKDSFALINQDLYLMNPGVYEEKDFSLNENREVILNPD